MGKSSFQGSVILEDMQKYTSACWMIWDVDWRSFLQMHQLPNNTGRVQMILYCSTYELKPSAQFYANMIALPLVSDAATAHKTSILALMCICTKV